MRRGSWVAACTVILLATMACTDDESAGQETPTIPTQEEAMRDARESIDENNADAAFEELRDEIESDQVERER